MMRFLTAFTVTIVLSTSAASACFVPPGPYTLKDVERIVAAQKGFGFRGKVLERFYRTESVPVSPGKPPYETNFFDFKVEIIESFGRDLKGVVLLKEPDKHRGPGGCSFAPPVGLDTFFILYNREAEKLSVLDTGR